MYIYSLTVDKLIVVTRNRHDLITVAAVTVIWIRHCETATCMLGTREYTLFSPFRANAHNFVTVPHIRIEI